MEQNSQKLTLKRITTKIHGKNVEKKAGDCATIATTCGSCTCWQLNFWCRFLFALFLVSFISPAVKFCFNVTRRRYCCILETLSWRHAFVFVFPVRNYYNFFLLHRKTSKSSGSIAKKKLKKLIFLVSVFQWRKLRRKVLFTSGEYWSRYWLYMSVNRPVEKDWHEQCYCGARSGCGPSWSGTFSRYWYCPFCSMELMWNILISSLWRAASRAGLCARCCSPSKRLAGSCGGLSMTPWIGLARWPKQSDRFRLRWENPLDCAGRYFRS